jgi:2-polyprenyl-3-methyl-5-hydroxy-6-metoxy-1,4-benzoquinol methylase
MIINKNHIDNVKTHFDINAQEWKDLYFKFNDANDLVLSNRTKIALDFLCKYLKHGSIILDAGCGAGIFSINAVQKGFFVHGIDISTKMIELCKETFYKKGIDTSKYRFLCGDFVDIDFPDNYFDAVIALGFLEYQKDEYEILERLRKIIRPGGLLICSGPIKIKFSNYFGLGALGYKGYKTIGSRLSKNIARPISINKYDLSKFKVLMKSIGFDLIDYKRHGYASFMIIDKLIGPKGDFLLYRFFNKLSKFLPIDRWANDIIVVAVKS